MSTRIVLNAATFTCGYIKAHATALTRMFITSLFVAAVISAYAAGLWTATQAKEPVTMPLVKAIMTGPIPMLMIMVSFAGCAFGFILGPSKKRGSFLSTAFEIERDFIIAMFIGAIILAAFESPNRATTGKAGFPNQLSTPVQPVPTPQLR
jgi:hypothetical protein